MLKLWKVNAKAGDATVKYPFAPFPTNKDMRGKPEHNAELCIACGACGVACPADAIRMDTDLAADTITWSIDYGRCIFCGRCEEACPMEAIKLTEEFELAVMSKDDLTSKSVYTLEHCSRCGKPFAPHKEIDYAKRLLQKAGGMEAIQAARAAYDALSDQRKAQVSNYDVLLAAEKKLAQLQDEAVAHVEELIDAIGQPVIPASRAAVEAARAAYDALGQKLQERVGNYDVLLAAEARLAELNAQDIYKTTGDFIVSKGAPVTGSIGGEWAVIGLARSGYPVPANYFDDYYARVEKYVKNCSGVLHERKYTEYSRVILALTAIGRNPSKVAGYNLLMPLGDFEKTIWQGMNGPIWALIALDSGNYDIPKNPAAKTQATRQLYIDEIIKNQMKDGGWSLTGTGDSDVDITAMALQALAKYQDQKAVKTATDKALAYLSNVQDSKGGFASWGTTNVESVAQVVVALCELGVSLDDSRFVKSGHTLTENLLSFRQSNGGFYHVLDGSDGNNQMSSEQGFYALVAIDRAANGQNSLYRMDDVTKNTSKPSTSVSKGNVDASVNVPGVTAPGTTFTDIKNHANKAAIEELASRGIINGMGKGTFMPNKTMTRAEFAAIVTRALGLAAKDTKAFTDVPSSKWYAGYIGTANSSGIVNGVGSGKFNPDGTITRQEAAAMVARAAKLCGLDPSMDAAATKDMLAQFGDYRSVASWAKEPMAFCYSVNILDQSDLNIEPTKAILRCEIAQMLYNMLSAAELI